MGFEPEINVNYTLLILRGCPGWPYGVMADAIRLQWLREIAVRVCSHSDKIIENTVRAHNFTNPAAAAIERYNEFEGKIICKDISLLKHSIAA